ncbi:MAG TPA: cytochrome c maturation protein CcmE, partial [Candidatus Dormibacteraeota bacterium]|nr:cytochrome c maturation protein CcmE [Candidatus Dormibacteraeota bacterium]
MNVLVRWGLPGVVVAACIGYLIYSASAGSTPYYLTVSQLRSNPHSGDVRVAGVVQDDVQRTDGGLHVT